jgi:hypothetical protein
MIDMELDDDLFEELLQELRAIEWRTPNRDTYRKRIEHAHDFVHR